MNILIIKLGALGDFIFQSGFIFALHDKYPEAHFSFMTTKPFVPFVKLIPFISEVIVDERPRYDLKAWWNTCKKQLADKKWDMIFDLQSSNRTLHKYFPIARFLSPHPIHWAFFDAGGFSIVNVQKKHRCAWGISNITHLDFPVPPVNLNFCKGEEKYFHLLPAKKFLLVVPGCSPLHPYKKWPAEKYLEIVRKAEEKGVPSVILGTRSEQAEIDLICHNSKAINFQNKSTILDIPSLAKRACLILGNDTGPVHMSCFSKTPAVVLFCKKTEKSIHQASNITNIVVPNLKDLSVEKVWTEIVHILKR